MNKSPLTTVLTGALVISTLVSLLLCYLFIQYTRETRNLQGQVMNVSLKRNVVNALATEAVEYGKKNPSIIPVLQAAGVSAPGLAPATKPTTK